MKSPFSRHLLSLALVLAVCASFAVITVSASGNLSTPKPTKQQIADKWLTVTNAIDIYEAEPTTTAPYSPGKLTDSFLNSGLSFLNYVRYVANLPAVQLNDVLNEDAQYGAVLLAAVDTLTHYPSQPSDMDDDFYSRGSSATASSNLSARYGYNPLGALQSSVSSCMDDMGSLTNMTTLGHRRWLLHPQLLNVGFGYAKATSGYDYIATKVVDHSGAAVNYDYVAWPASGNFPADLFHSNAAWSVTLNPSKYATPQLSQITVTLTRASDGQIWQLNGATSTPNTAGNPYLSVNTVGYGVNNCIIFLPGVNPSGGYSGVYKVTIAGIYTRAGQPTTLTYEVDFFNILDYLPKPAITEQPKDITAKLNEDGVVSVQAAGDGLTYKWYIKFSGDTEFRYINIQGSECPFTMSRTLDGAQLYCVVTNSYGNIVVSDTVTLTLDLIPLSISTQPKDVTVTYGQKAKVTVEAEGEGLTYQWFWAPKDGNFQPTESFTGSSYSVTMNASRSGRKVYCVITDQYGDSVKTDTVTLTGESNLQITSQPKGKAVAAGKTAKVTVKAEGDGLKYQWYVKDPGKSKFSKSSVTKSTYSVTMTAARSGRQVYCVVTDSAGNKVKSDVVTISRITISSQPKDDTAASNKRVSATVKAVGDGLKYQWYVKDPGKTKFTKSSVKKATYGYNMTTAKSGREAYCVITDKYGNSVTTDTVVFSRLYVKTQPKSVKVASGKTAKVTVKAVGENLTYTWYVKNPGASKFTKSSVTKSSYSITMNKSRSGRQVYCVITDKYGNTIKTNTVTLKMK